MTADVHLLHPPATAPWARISLRAKGPSCLAEIKTEWDNDEAVRRSRRGFFDSMVQAVKRLPDAKFDQALKAWEINGSGIQQLLENLGRLGFGVPGDLQQSLFGHERSGSGPKAAVDLEEDSDAEIEELLKSGWIDRVEAEVRSSWAQEPAEASPKPGEPQEPLDLEPAEPPTREETRKRKPQDEPGEPAAAALPLARSPSPDVEAQQPPATAGPPECAICMDSAAATVFVPCGHMAACVECGERLAKKPCPVCRKKIKKVQRVFAAWAQ